MVVKSAARILDVLELLSLEQQAGLRLTEIASRVGMPKSSATMLLRTLEARCYTTRGEDGRYRLHRLFLEAPGWVGGQFARLLHVARPVMTGLVEQTGETCFLATLSPDLRVRILHKVVSPHEVRYDTELGPLRPAYCTSVGRVQLAFLPPERIRAYLDTTHFERFTEHTPTTSEVLEVDLSAIRRRGYADSIDERQIGASGVSAPVLGPDGAVVAGLNLSAVTQRFVKQQDAMRDAVVEAAEAIGMAYGSTVSRRSGAVPAAPPALAGTGPL